MKQITKRNIFGKRKTKEKIIIEIEERTTHDININQFRLLLSYWGLHYTPMFSWHIVKEWYLSLLLFALLRHKDRLPNWQYLFEEWTEKEQCP